MMLTVGMVIKGNGIDSMAIWNTADELVDARRVKEEPQGIVAIKKKRNAK